MAALRQRNIDALVQRAFETWIHAEDLRVQPQTLVPHLESSLANFDGGGASFSAHSGWIAAFWRAHSRPVSISTPASVICAGVTRLRS